MRTLWIPGKLVVLSEKDQLTMDSMALGKFQNELRGLKVKRA